MVKERKDALKNKAKIVKAVIKSPLKTQRELAKETKLAKTTIQQHLKELPKMTKDDRILDITDKDLEIVKIAQNIIKDKLNDSEQIKKLKPSEISTVAKDSTARYTIFRGDVTDKYGGLRYTREQLMDMSDDELLHLI